jgi:putative endonuclease
MNETSSSSWWTYIVECADGTYYTGSTNEINRRVAQHNNGTGAKYTRSHRPVSLVYVEQFQDRSTAMKRESQIKKLQHWEKRQLIEKFLTGQST